MERWRDGIQKIIRGRANIGPASVPQLQPEFLMLGRRETYLPEIDKNAGTDEPSLYSEMYHIPPPESLLNLVFCFRLLPRAAAASARAGGGAP